jgi:uncharacterized protein YxeA
MKKQMLFLVLISVLSLSCYSIENPLIGEWVIFKIQDFDGEIKEIPISTTMRMVYSKNNYTQYQQGKPPKKYDYTLHNDQNGLYIKVSDNGKVYGQLFTVIDSNTVRWNLCSASVENGQTYRCHLVRLTACFP